jgi:hypothetical protein
MNSEVFLIMAVIQQAGVPALRIVATLAVVLFLFGGVFIFRKRNQLFGSDPNVENDFPVVRHNRLDGVLFVWAALTLVLVSILYQVWSA